MDHGESGVGSGPTRPLRVLVVIKCLGLGGAERLLVDTVGHGDRERFDYEVAWVLEAERALVPALEAAGTRTHPLGATGNRDMSWLRRLRRLLRGGDFDVVHFHLPHTAALGRLVVASLPHDRRPAIVYTEHSLWNRMAVLVRMVNRAGIGLDQSLIVVSEAARQALPRTLRARARVIVHGVDLEAADALVAERPRLRAEVREELGVPDGDLLAVTVANLRPEKGYDTLLDAATPGRRSPPARAVRLGRPGIRGGGHGGTSPGAGARGPVHLPRPPT